MTEEEMINLKGWMHNWIDVMDDEEVNEVALIMKYILESK